MIARPNSARYFPEVFEDETIFSIVQRLVALHSGPVISHTVFGLFHSSSLKFCSSFPSVIPELAEMSRISPNDWVHKHTILPVFRLFVGDARFGMAQDDLKRGKGEHIFKSLSLIANRQSESGSINFCSQCVIEDKKDVGVPYFHVTHQLPGVHTCHQHIQALTSIPVSRKRFDQWPIIKQQKRVFAHPLLLRLTRFMHAAHSLSNKLKFGHTLSSIYRVALNDRGYITGAGQLRLSHLRGDLKTFWKPLLTYPEIASIFDEKRHPLFPGCFFNSDTSIHTPLKHMLLIAFLFDDFYELKKADDNYAEISFSQIPSKLCASEQSGEQEVLVALKNGHSLRQVAEQMQRSISFVKKVALLNGLKIDSRAQRIFKTETRAISIKLLAGMPTEGIANKFDCSQAAVEQILTQQPDIVDLRKKRRFYQNRQQKRLRMTQAIEVITNATRNDLKKAVSGSYMWLFRHDKDWLYSVLPPAIPRKERGRRYH